MPSGVETVARDNPYALTMMRRNKGFTAAGLLTLAIEVCATTVVSHACMASCCVRWAYPNADSSGRPRSTGRDFACASRCSTTVTRRVRLAPSLRPRGFPASLRGGDGASAGGCRRARARRSQPTFVRGSSTNLRTRARGRSKNLRPLIAVSG